MYADFKLKFDLQFLPFEHFRYVYSSVLIQPLRSHRLDPARPMSMHGPLHGCSARPNLEAVYTSTCVLLWFCTFHLVTPRHSRMPVKHYADMIAAIRITITIHMSDTSVDNGTMIMNDRMIKISHRSECPSDPMTQ